MHLGRRPIDPSVDLAEQYQEVKRLRRMVEKAERRSLGIIREEVALTLTRKINGSSFPRPPILYKLRQWR